MEASHAELLKPLRSSSASFERTSDRGGFLFSFTPDFGS